ncbi:zinc finger C2HC domain-containing protein 1C [Drosophila ficusphila]|uniref:zinc finger C2HC domain-containing protein 1C n=1 Tax=Drosophila ficusphila TaxID=30025 RepID=UPI0007E77A20|nr:zinc finger C2HC domain-containing protein 1C [Drosophila ficusphila]
MASEAPGEMKNSRLAQMQMRFQQRTQQEQEVRRRELMGAKTSVESLTGGAPSAATTRLIGNGKVRQMFDERRRGAGIDRSHPLKPIGTLPSPPAQAKTRTQQPMQRLVKGVSDMNLGDPPNAGRRVTSDSNNNSKFATPRTVNRNLKPVVTRKTPPAQEATPTQQSPFPPQRSPRMQASNRLTGGTTAQSIRPSPPPIRRSEPKSPVKKVNMTSATAAPEGTALCRHCGRHFNTDRLGKHEAVCQRMVSTKRKIFDAAKQRVEGTEAEKYNRKPKGMRTQTSSYSSAAQQKGLTTGVKKNNWRKKHEEFIQSIRAAKQVQLHLARGGKLSDLPPPPPSENPDYIQCPHCGRRFNQQAAERHIPKCANMIHNKPRNGPPPKRR